jgi:hydroxyethylthiazole kinase-like uncharacterized protein yjeF
MQHAVPLYDSKAIRDVEIVSRAALGSDDVLMQRAGSAAWRDLLARWPDAQRILVVCGPGNNGSDGYALATQILQHGRAVQLVQSASPRTAPAQRAHAAFVAAGGRILQFGEKLPDADVLVDALFGIGLSRAPDAEATRLIEAINSHTAKTLALDVPSGVDADTGHVPGSAVHADATLQFIAAHCGLVTGAAMDYCGQCSVASLDVTPSPASAVAFAMTRSSLSDWLQPRPLDSHKGRYGHVLCAGGDRGHGGAIALCADAALRCGAGLVSVATRTEHVAALLARRPEAMVTGIEHADDIATLLEAATVVAIGPGLGTQTWGRALLDRSLGCGKPLVLDADALNLLAISHRKMPADSILTPHPGEAARLLGITTQAVQAHRFTAASSLVERFQCVVVLKGAGTIVAAPGEIPRVVTAGNPGMAVGGMGDLLTGAIAALRAQGLTAFDAACSGAVLHASAGDIAASDGGQRGLLPTDLLPALRLLANPAGAT